jgi:hypothetical protein
MASQFFCTPNKHKPTHLLVGVLCALVGCEPGEALESNDLLYFPLKVGHTWIYDVEETTINRASCTDNGVVLQKYELQVVVKDSLPNSDQGFAYVMQHSKRERATDEWVPFATWTAQLMGNKMVVNEGNINFVKLLIPISNNLVWNGNLFNNRQELNGLNVDDYKATLVGQSFTSPLGDSFEKTVTVVQNEEQDNIIYRDSRLEVYAYEVGLVYKEAYLLSYFANSQLPCYAQKRTQQGITYKQVLEDFSK